MNTPMISSACPWGRRRRPGRFELRSVAVLATVLAASPCVSAAEVAESEATISLPPMLVEERLTPLRWRYLELPGLEVLSLCDDAVTREFVRRCYRLEQVLREIVPARFQGTSSVPEIQILFNEDLRRAKAQEIMEEMLRREKQHPRPSWSSAPFADAAATLPTMPFLATHQRSRVQFLPNLRLSDIDVTAVFAATHESNVNLLEFTFIADRIRYLLERRVPALPDWFIVGTVGFYERTQLRDDGITIDSAWWISEADTRVLLEDDHPRTLWPMQELFAARRPRPGEEQGAHVEVWRAQCALFVRWALLEENGARKEALWNFVDRLETNPLSEELFRECFGLGFADVRDRLSDYLPDAVARGATMRAPKLIEPPDLKPRAATDLEIARLRGEWERMQISYVRRRFPEMTAKYVDQTRNTLDGAYGRGERDPRLLASIGLTECDAGNSTGARAFLEAAARAKVVRPRVYLELARMRYDVVRAEAGEAKLDAAQVERVLEPLRALRTLEPPLPEAFGLLAEVLSRSAHAPTADDLAWLTEGATKFPRFSPLVLRTIYLVAAYGLVDVGTALARSGLREAGDEETRQKFERVLAQLTAAGARGRRD
jgi:hypothetical protein